MTTEESSARRLYGARAMVYDEPHHPAFAQWMVNEAHFKAGEKLLDLACGTGLIAFAAAPAVGPTGSIIGIDVSDGMLAQARERAEKGPEQYKSIRFFNHDIASLPSLGVLKEGSFDIITCNSTLVLLRDPLAALKQWIAYLKPGGRLIVDVIHERNQLSGLAWEKVHNRLGVRPPFQRLWVKSQKSVEEIIREAGFDMEKSQFQFKDQGIFGKRYRAIDEGVKEANTSQHSEFNRTLKERGLMEKGKQAFPSEWASFADEEGKILEIDGVYIATAFKPLASSSAALSTSVVVKGSCACSSIVWSSTARPTNSSNCFCVTCRKIAGSPFITFADFPLSSVTFTPPLSSTPVKIYRISQHAKRGFCSNCGSTLTMSYDAEPDTIAIAMGTIDEDESREGVLAALHTNHIWVRSKPSWYEIPDDGLERQDTMASAGLLLGGNTE